VDPIDRTLATADRAWRAYGVRRADREELAADLRLDLESAAADGVDPARLLGADVPGFARRLADEAGIHREPPEFGLLLGTALVGAALGAALGFAAMMLAAPVAIELLDPDPAASGIPVQVAVGVYYGVPAAIVVAGAVVTVRYRLRDLPRIRATALAMAVLLPLAGIVVTPVTMAFAWATDFSTSASVVLTELLLVAGTLAGATVLARRWALREHAEPAPAAPA
jgi:hypothetical protein